MREIARHLQSAALMTAGSTFVCMLSYSGSCSGAVLRRCGNVQLQQYCYNRCCDGAFLRSCAVGHRVLPELEVSFAPPSSISPL